MFSEIIQGLVDAEKEVTPIFGPGQDAMRLWCNLTWILERDAGIVQHRWWRAQFTLRQRGLGAHLGIVSGVVLMMG